MTSRPPRTDALSAPYDEVSANGAGSRVLSLQPTRAGHRSKCYLLK
jgi:hypothetical protein